DPDNVAARIRLGEQYARQDNLIEAVAELRRAAQYLQRNGRTDDYLRVAERISHLDQGDVTLAKELAESYLSRGDSKRALAELQPAVLKAAAPQRPAPQPIAKVAVVPPAPARPPTGPVQARQPVRPPTSPIQSARPPTAPIPTTPGSSAPPTAAAVPKLLKETEVYIKYGLHEKALEHLRKIFSADPDNLEAHEKAKTVALATGRTADAVASLSTLLRLAVERGDPRADAARAELKEVDAAH